MLRPFTRFGVRGAEKKLTQINEHQRHVYTLPCKGRDNKSYATKVTFRAFLRVF